MAYPQAKINGGQNEWESLPIDGGLRWNTEGIRSANILAQGYERVDITGSFKVDWKLKAKITFDPKLEVTQVYFRERQSYSEVYMDNDGDTKLSRVMQIADDLWAKGMRP